MIGILRLGCAALMTVAATVILYLLDNRVPAVKNMPYMAKQILFGVIFGAMAVCGTEFGIEYSGAVVNVRDAAPICAGLIFGAPAGIIAGIIGGIERWFAVYWGVGVYTRLACTVATIVAGLFAAFIRKRIMDDKKPAWFYALALAMVVEVFHMLMVFLTHLSAYEEAFVIVAGCAPLMITMNSLAVGLAVLIVNRTSREPITLLSDRRSVIQAVEVGLFITVVISFLITNAFVMVLQNQIARTDAQKTITYTLNDVKSDIHRVEAKGHDVEHVFSATLQNRHIGDTGGLIVVDKDLRVIALTLLSGDFSEKYGATLEEYSREQVQHDCYENSEIILENASESPKMFDWHSGDLPMYLMILDEGDYYIIGYYPKAEADLQKNTTEMITAFVIILIMAALFIQIFILIRRVVVKNVVRINEKLAQITAGDLDVKVDVGGSREFISLSEGINETVASLKRLTEKEKERIARELDLAKNIQYSALNREFPESNRFALYANMLAAKEIGGDFYDFYRISDDKCALAIADVSGKGIPAALFMMRSKTLINGLVDSGVDVATVLTKANEELCTNNDAEMFVTAWVGILDLSTNIITYANAGHNPPVLIRNDGRVEFLKSRPGLVLAGMEGMKYKSFELQLEEGDSLFLYTDGVTEATNADNELYGDDRLLEELAETYHMQPDYMCKYIKSSIDSFAGNAPQFDDITMLAVRIKSDKEQAMELVVVPKENTVPEVEGYFERRIEELEVPIKIASKIGIIVDEIYSNVVNYSKATIAKVSCDLEDGVLNIQFKDNGIEYNPLDRDDPDISLSAEEREIGGLGIYMVRNMADDVQYMREDGKNILSIFIRM
ncbi:MAG: SpoIIE family protein phosphatase [Clostridia bacterium]|nr:SpoIIE family protein phosphatase [Clostridia bacterium]